jgi:hypothetical protein
MMSSTSDFEIKKLSLIVNTNLSDNEFLREEFRTKLDDFKKHLRIDFNIELQAVVRRLTAEAEFRERDYVKEIQYLRKLTENTTQEIERQ